MKKLLASLCLIALTACTVGPDFTRPADPSAESYTIKNFPGKTTSSEFTFGQEQRFDRNNVLEQQWWRTFGSSKLDEVIARAMQANPTLLAAQSTLKQAQELYSARAGSTLYPQLNATLSDQRVQLNGATQGLSTSPNVFNLYNATVGVTYNFDIFGGNRRILEALASRADYQQYQLLAAKLTLAANISTTAITQAKLAGQIKANETSLKAQEDQLIVARNRLRLGQASEDDVLALTTEAEQTRAGIPVLHTRYEQTRHLLSTLSGQAPGQSALPTFVMSDFTLPTDLPLLIPSELVRQRPDIQASEALMRASNAEYGAAIAKMYPQLNLSASIGSLALAPASLFGTGALFWQVLGQLSQPVFNPGLPAESRAALAAFEATASNYQMTVLDALRNVADVLKALENDAMTLKSQSTANSAARDLAKSVERQYTLGSASYLQLLIAQLQDQRTRFELIAAQAQRLIDTVALYQALGGAMLTSTVSTPRQTTDSGSANK